MKRALSTIAGLIAAGAMVAAPAAAQTYPNKPVRMVIAFPAGGSIDTLGRILAQRLTEAWGQNVVVENRPGAGGNLGAAAAAHGKVRALAVSGRTRAEALPNIPTLKEQGVDMDEEASWYALFVPKGTPKEIVAKVNRDVERILALPDIKERGVTLGYRYAGGPPERLAAFLKNETDKWAVVAKKADLVAR